MAGWFALLLIFAFPPTARSVESCDTELLRSLFTVEVGEGRLSSIDDLFARSPYSKLEYTAHELGSGGNGTVYRVTPRNHPNRSFILKSMSEMSVYNDSLGFELLREAGIESGRVRIAKAKILPSKFMSTEALSGPVVMQFEDTRGRSLYRLLADPAVPSKVKQELTREYDHFNEQVKNYFAKRFKVQATRRPAEMDFFPEALAANEEVDLALQPDLLTIELPFGEIPQTGASARMLERLKADPRLRKYRTRVKLTLKSDNFIVTPDYELVLIDPY